MAVEIPINKDNSFSIVPSPLEGEGKGEGDVPFSPTQGKRPLNVINLGETDYARALQLQRNIAAAVAAGELPDTLLLLEHPPVFTVGRGGKDKNILVSEKILQREGISVFHIDRGGDVTYHGPGQIVGYPIMDLRYHGRDIHLYVRGVEETIIRTLRDMGIAALRRPGLVGVWVGEEKIASIGINVRRWITTHGFAFNIDPDLEHFHLINPCGLRGVRVTSVARLLRRPVDSREVRTKLAHHFSEVFALEGGLQGSDFGFRNSNLSW